MADPIEQLRKLLALALHNPNEEEARSAAMAAAKLIESKNLIIGGVTVTIPVKDWETPTASEFGDILSAIKKEADPAESWEGQTSGDQGITMANLDSDLDPDFMRHRVTLAWRAIRRIRKQLEGEIHRYEIETHRKFGGMF